MILFLSFCDISSIVCSQISSPAALVVHSQLPTIAWMYTVGDNKNKYIVVELEQCLYCILKLFVLQKRHSWCALSVASMFASGGNHCNVTVASQSIFYICTTPHMPSVPLPHSSAEWVAPVCPGCPMAGRQRAGSPLLAPRMIDPRLIDRF